MATLSSAHGGSVEDLIDRYLGPLYPHYADHTRPMLIRQARDLLVCTFHGDLERFEGHFLRPATDIVRELRCTYELGKKWDNTALVSSPRVSRGSNQGRCLATAILPKLVHRDIGIDGGSGEQVAPQASSNRPKSEPPIPG
ncbi:AGAP006188-PC-like protein [Anopheles sinensis]|uniref:AGAP006188-PC-like protein n=1 Tax=Anopheles sinensis TaxID=74873 RepID=A0A084WL71_ANOSI|nr:AGAP006188-PC-like protein [Anopheles sinensis]